MVDMLLQTQPGAAAAAAAIRPVREAARFGFF
jgi:hypothetical protein